MTHTKRTKAVAIGLAAALFGWGCSDLSVEGGGPLDLTLTASETSAEVGTEIEFDYDAQGRYLRGIIFDYGDGSPLDSVPASGAQSAHGRRLHTFEEPGEFQVRGTVEDASEGSLTRTVVVQISPVTPSPSR